MMDITGSRGTGKTTIWQQKLAQLMEEMFQNGILQTRKVLVLCYHKSTKRRFQKFFNELNSNLSEKYSEDFKWMNPNEVIDQITIDTYKSFLVDKFGVDEVALSNRQQRNKEIRKIEKSKFFDGIEQFSHIFLDEAHYYFGNWFKVFQKILDPDLSSLYCFYDKFMLKFNKGNARVILNADKSMDIRLNQLFNRSGRIDRFLQRLFKARPNDAVGVEGSKVGLKSCLGKRKYFNTQGKMHDSGALRAAQLILSLFHARNTDKRFMTNIVKESKQNPFTVGIIFQHKSYALKCRKHLKKLSLDTLSFEISCRKSIFRQKFFVGCGKSLKNQEFSLVILFYPAHVANAQKRFMYTALTRATEGLVIITSRKSIRMIVERVGKKNAHDLLISLDTLVQ